ncbi:MAG: integrase core domain-containing protein [Candidatus Zeuxoniibacter abyssi]|nr:MAG: integrase core domain-containing protein [Candidatus Persebacteraceae bacterium AB1(2)]
MMVSSKSARSSAQVLRGMEAFLLAPIQTILTDNGTEFDGEFARATADKDITRFYTHPNCPQQNAVNERFNRTVRESFLETHEDLIDDLQQMNEASADWLTGYNGFRHHRSFCSYR